MTISNTILSPQMSFRSEEAIVSRFRSIVRKLSLGFQSEINLLTEGSEGRRAFIRRTMRMLQVAYYEVYLLGTHSIDPFHSLTGDEIDEINSELLGERRFLQGFARDLGRSSVLELAPESRARLYLQALRGIFELGRLAALPGGPYDWILGDTDHCIPCLQASLSGPYRLERSLLNLPVVPGIPGSGEICSGLTRCGCTLRLQGFEKPNESLQLQLRELISEVM